MKKYFWSGETTIQPDGQSKHTWGIVDVKDDEDPFKVAQTIVKQANVLLESDSFRLQAFNLVS